MAAREGDAALWLHNKLGSTDDLWSGKSICSQLNHDKLVNIQGCFRILQPHVKVKLMLSFLHLPKRQVDEWKVELEEILDIGANDTDQWVSAISEMLRPFPSTGQLNLNLDEVSPAFSSIVNDLRKLVRKGGAKHLVPLECIYLNQRAASSVLGLTGRDKESGIPPPDKHFQLKRKPKSAALRADLLQKAQEAHQNPKSGSSLPIKFRSMAKNMDSTTPMKGIKATPPPSGGFRPTPNSTGPRLTGTPLSARQRKPGGVKLIGLEETPLIGREGRKKRRQLEHEAAAAAKKEKQQHNTSLLQPPATPGYAADLLSPAMRGDLSSGDVPFVTTVGEPRPQQSAAASASDHLTQQRDQLSLQLQQQLAAPSQDPPPPLVTSPTLNLNSSLAQHLQQGQVGEIQQQQQQPATVQPQNQQQPQQAGRPATQPQQIKKDLSLTREQMMEAQEMFRNSNRVTRPEKALILGFMAGSRENPCRAQGDIVNIRLSEDLESLEQPDGTFRPMYIDVYFQMNYATGDYRRVKKYREIPADS